MPDWLVLTLCMVVYVGVVALFGMLVGYIMARLIEWTERETYVGRHR